MRYFSKALPAALVMGAALLGCGTATSTTSTTAASAAAVGCSTQGATAVASTASYRIVLDVRPAAEMFAPGQVPAGSTAGEVMYAGSMTSAAGSDARDVNVHICTAVGDRVLTSLKPVISLKDTTSGTTQSVPYATMQGLGQGRGDFHYGNTLTLAPGHSYVLTVSVGGQSARLSFTEAKGSVAGTMTSTTMAKMNMSTTTTAKSTGSTSTTMAHMKMSTTTMANMKMSTTTMAR